MRLLPPFPLPASAVSADGPASCPAGNNNIRLEEPDSEGKVTSVLNRMDAWKASKEKDFDRGANLAETAANLLESAQLAPMHIAPLYEVNQVRKSRDIKELSSLVDKFYAMLEPYKKQ